jgi:SAM-dependent methyltransferase
MSKIDVLRELGFTHMGNVLDAGCGKGEWSTALAVVDNVVIGIDTNQRNINIAEDQLLYSTYLYKCVKYYIVNMEDDITMLNALHDALANIDKFDAVFCYSAVYLTNWKKTLAAFKRVLEPGGTLYFTTNGIGWYLDNILHRKLHRFAWRANVMSPKATSHYLASIGFKDIRIEKDPYYDLKWHGLDYVFAVRATA